MLFEHLIYSIAIAIIAGMLWYKYTGRDPSWIIIASAYAPDFDILAGELFKKLDMNILIDGAPFRHGDFHNIAFMLLFACGAALVLRLAGMRFRDSFLFAGIGFGVHMFEDALVFNPGYAFLWPVSKQEFGIGIIEYRPDWYGIANTDVLILGLITVLLCGCIRVAYEGKEVIKRIAKAFGVALALMILMSAIFAILDIKVKEDVNPRTNTKFRYIDFWSYAQNASWDSTVFHNGDHSAKIEILGNEIISWGPCGKDKFGYEVNSTVAPVGGAEGYSKIINRTNADYIVNDRAELLSALSSAVGGNIIYINDSAEINLTSDQNIIIPANVTLASGRGKAGSTGALLYSNRLMFTNGVEVSYILFKAGGPGVRITGLRIQGNDNEIRNSAGEYTLSLGIYSLYNIEIDNSEIMNWSDCAICLYGTQLSYIHNNYIHHNRRTGYGYGVVLAYNASSIIEANIFDWNRHSITGDGRVNTSYTARYNLVLGNGNGQSFDMHGGVDRGDGTNISGKTIYIYSNTFFNVYNNSVSYPAIRIRGIPTNGAWIYNNNLKYDSQEESITQVNAFGNMSVYNNCFNGYLDVRSGNYFVRIFQPQV